MRKTLLCLARPIHAVVELRKLSRSRLFWVMVVSSLLAAVFCYAPQIDAPSVFSVDKGLVVGDYAAAYRLFFLVAVAIAAWRFGVKGGLIVCITVGTVILSRVLVGFSPSTASIDLAAICIGIVFSVVAGRQGEQSEALKAEIAERKRSEEAVLVKNALLEAQAESSIDGILAFDEKGEVILHNRHLQEMWRIPPGVLDAKMYGLALRHIISEAKDHEFLERMTMHVGQDGDGGRAEVELQDGKTLDVFLSPLVDTNGIHRGRIWYFRDITDRKQLQRRLVMTDRLASIGELVAGVAHELNNPLTGVIGFSQLVLEKEVPDDVRQDLAVVSSEAQRAAQIVRDLLTFARKHAPVKAPTQVNDIVEDILRLRQYEQKVNNIEVIKHLAPNLPEIMADYFQLQQVFLNIVINAEHFMVEARSRGRLTISTERVGGVVRVSFTDDGPGIPPDNLDRIFDPFFTTKEVGKGTGLGLSICHGIVSEHGGRIHAESAPGNGATFVVELPVQDEHLVSGEQTANTDPGIVLSSIN